MNYPSPFMMNDGMMNGFYAGNILNMPKKEPGYKGIENKSKIV